MHHFYCFTYNFWALPKGKDASKHAWNVWLHYNAHLMVYHHNDVTMGAKASQITSLTIVNSIVNSDADQRKPQSSASLVFVSGIQQGPVNSPHKWPVTRKIFPFDDVIMFIHLLSWWCVFECGYCCRIFNSSIYLWSLRHSCFDILRTFCELPIDQFYKAPLMICWFRWWLGADRQQIYNQNRCMSPYGITKPHRNITIFSKVDHLYPPRLF